MSHTPGPWTLRMATSTWDPESEPYPVAVVDAKGDPIRLTCVTITGSQPEPLANARLLAAAPELLELLKQFVSDIETDDPIYPSWIDAAHAAIAKAENK